MLKICVFSLLLMPFSCFNELTNLPCSSFIEKKIDYIYKFEDYNGDRLGVIINPPPVAPIDNPIELEFNASFSRSFSSYGESIKYSFNSGSNSFVNFYFYSIYDFDLFLFNANNVTSSNHLSMQNLSYGNNVFYCETNTNYIVQIKSRNNSFSSYAFDFLPVTSSLANNNLYFLHVSFDDSYYGYKYSVEYHNLSIESSSPTEGYINSITSSHYNGPFYCDILNTLDYSFDIPNDTRILVDNPLYDAFSGIACGTNNAMFYSTGAVNGDGGYSGVFVDETTVLTAAHCAYGNLTFSKQSHTMVFEPGNNNYNVYNHNQNYCGEYTVTEFYSPISYKLYPSQATQFDWAICLTNESCAHVLEHSYFGLQNFSKLYTNYAISCGYPSLQWIGEKPTIYKKDMWISSIDGQYCSKNTGDEDILISSSIIISPGNSGGPLLEKNNDGTYSLIGITDAHGYYNGVRYSYSARISHILINLYNEVADND